VSPGKSGPQVVNIISFEIIINLMGFLYHYIEFFNQLSIDILFIYLISQEIENASMRLCCLADNDQLKRIPI